MAEKLVSVRLVAEGGRRVRAELEGTGDAGAKGFGHLSREMDRPTRGLPLSRAASWFGPSGRRSRRHGLL